MSINDEKWAEIFKDLNIPHTVAEQGHFIITADKIKEYREPRLMTKIDHRSSLPKVFADHGLAILPISRGSYILAPISAYEDIPEAQVEPIHVPFPDHILSLDYSRISSESAALGCAYVSGMLADFLQADDLLPTVSGRMGSGDFSFTIDRTVGGAFEIDVENAQIEIDGGYESRDALTLIEAKIALPNDFIVRQIYYPYRLWNEKIGARKRIRTVFMTYSNGIFTFYEYIFTKPEHYNSLFLQRQKRYVIMDERITRDDLRRAYKETALRAEPKGIPFPQADSFARVINICEILHRNEILARDEVSDLYAFDPRQTDYYTSAAIYLGLISRERAQSGETIYTLSDEGRRVMAANLKQRNLEFAKLILRQQPFRRTFEFFLKYRQLPSKDVVVDYMKTSNLYRVSSESTFHRRASTVLAWVGWIIGLIQD